MPEDSTTTKNPTATRADFTYSITTRTLIIKDTGQGKKTVLEDLRLCYELLSKVVYRRRAHPF
jgi:predicted ATP-binding protein involved in virulence